MVQHFWQSLISTADTLKTSTQITNNTSMQSLHALAVESNLDDTSVHWKKWRTECRNELCAGLLLSFNLGLQL